MKEFLVQWGGGYGPWGMGPGMGNWGGWFSMVFMVVFWILVVVGAIYLIKWLIGNFPKERRTSSGTDRALEILRERYARGEISREEFTQMKQDLNKLN